MTPERWRRVEAVFYEVVDLPADERAAHLVTACGSDDALRREIESLLASTPDAARSMREAIGEVAASLPRKDRLHVGQRLGSRYKILELLGEGGMGAVYRAHDDKLGEAVALKIVRGPVDEQLLRDEVRLAQRVTHPNVCRTFDLEEVDGHHLVKMEYVPGETLATRLAREGKLPIAECVRIARGVAAGLAAAHARHIVHGDLKPANIMLDGDRVLLMDFGVAWIAAAPVARVRGTVGYLAPELVRDRQADERADLYALGCVIYEMLAGEPVFPAATSTQVGARHVAMPVPKLRKKRPETPRWLANAVADLLAKRPEERELGRDRLVDEPRSRVLLALGILAAVGAVVHNWWPGGPAPWAAKVHDYEGFDENVDSMTFSPDGNWLLFSSDRVVAGSPHLYLMSVSTGETTELMPDQIADVVQWSRDGSSILFGDGQHTFRQRVEGSPPRPVGAAELIGAADMPGSCGDSIVMSDLRISGGRLLLRLPSGETRTIFTTARGDFIGSAPCDPSGQHIAIVAGDSFDGGHNDVYLADRDGHVQQLTTDHQTGNDAAFTPDGSSLVVSRLVDGRKQLFEMSLDGKHLRRILDDGGNDEPLEISRDGRYLVFARGDETYLPAIASAHGSQYLTRRRGVFVYPRELGANAFVATLLGTGGPELIVIDRSTSMTSMLGLGRHPFPSLDGSSIYFSDKADTHELYAVPSHGGPRTRIARLPGMIQFGNAASDGLHVAVGLDAGGFAGFRIHDGSVDREADGLVTPAPSGGWRAVTVYGESVLQTGAELYVLPPGATLDHAAHHVHVMSPLATWLDDRRIGYIVADHAEVLDVTTGATTSLPLADPNIPQFASVARDGEHVLGSVHDPRYTRHVITNFGDR